MDVMFVTLLEVTTLRVAGLTFGGERAMLRCNREPNSGVQLTGSVSIDYAANLRCTLTSPGTMSLAAGPRAFSVRALAVRYKLGRTPVGSLAQRLSYRSWSTSCLVRPYQGTTGGPQPPCTAD